MSTVTVENIVELINQLPALERGKLIEKLTRPLPAKPQIPKGKIIRVDAPYVDRTLEYEWLDQHEREYIGKWIALKGNQLIAEGETGVEVFTKVRELGIEHALVFLVDDPDVHYMGL